MSLSNMKVGVRLGLGFGVVLLLLAMIAGIGIKNVAHLNDELDDIVKDKFPKTVMANEVIADINVIARAMRNMLLETDKAKIDKELDRLVEARKQILDNLDKLKARITTDKGKELFQKILDARAKYVSGQDRFIELSKAGKQAEAKELLLSEIRETQRNYTNAVADVIKYQSDLMGEVGAQAAKDAHSAEVQTLIIAAIALLAGVIIGFLITRNLLKQLGGEPDYAAGVVHQIADGDLSMTIATKQGDTTSLLASMKVMQEALKRIVGDVQRIVDAANKGDFSVKLDTVSHKGFAKDIATGLNQLSDTIDGAFSDTIRVAQALAAGDLSQKVTKDYAGAFNQVKVAVNTTADSLTKIVAEIQTIVDDANRGDFSTKMDLAGKAGYTKTLSDLLNQLSDTVDGAFKDTIRVAQALAAGDLSQKVTQDYQGAYNDVKVAVNGTADALTRIVAEIQAIVEAANRGDFSTKMDLSGKAGYTKTLSDLLNQLSDTVDTAFKDTILVAQALAQGDLTQTVTRDYQGAFNDVKENLNATVTNLKQLVIQIKESVDAINTASKEIASGNQDLSQRTEEQASSLEETASSMEELTSTVKQNAENAKQANQLAAGSSDIAAKGGNVVRASVQTMADISDSSKKIADIIGVIDGIAFQTNILALNAAVEAARAGEQGRGFAVVAAEVRNLAQRSANAAKEIKTLITDSVSKVDSGTQQVNEAGQTMEEIVTSIKRVTDIMAEISAASVEQSSGIEQVNQAITQMDEVTQQNAALVEEAAAAAESLQEQAEGLARAVSVFKLDTTTLAVAKPKAEAKPKTEAKAKPHAKAAEHAAPKRALPPKAGDDEDWQEF